MTTAAESQHSKRIVQLCRYKKQYRGHSGTTEKDFRYELLFSVRNADYSPVAAETFWCEASIKENLLRRDGWKNLSKEDRIKALYCFAIEAIDKAGGRPVRQVDMSWMPQAPYAEGPIWDLSKVNLRKPEPVVLEGPGVVHVVVDQH